ncbi:MAG: hypothetical protein LBP91_04815 [Coriobacteriales bacterium]|nr:hypothetical protein [Coriobacteriales bacterium]
MTEQFRNNEVSKVIAHAPAKINLVLEIEPLEAEEEKHRLSSVFCTTTLADTLIFDFTSGKEPFNAQVTFESVDFDVSYIKKHNNTLTKTVEEFKRVYGFRFLPPGTLSVQLFKSIPAQAGLGGGSSDAAAMLRMLCWLAQVDPLSEKSLLVAQAVGADVPFFLYAPKGGLCAHMRGYGDELVEALPKPKLHLTLVKPKRGVSTKKAYAAFDARLEKGRGSVPSSKKAQPVSDSALSEPGKPVSTTGDTSPVPLSRAAAKLAAALVVGEGLDEIAALCSNNLESAAIDILPQVAALKKELCAFPGVVGATMSGSGSAVFAICSSAEESQACMRHFANKGLWSVAIQT